LLHPNHRLIEYDGFRILESEFLEAPYQRGQMPLKQIPTWSGHKPVWQGYSPEPIPFSKALAHEIQKEVMQAFLGNPLFYIVSDNIPDTARQEVKRFICALDGYRASPRPVVPFKVLLDGILDEHFASYLKKVRTKAIVASGRGVFDEDPGPEYEMLPKYKIFDVGDIFNFKYWILWAQKPEGDIEYSKIEVDIDPEALDNFYQAAVSLLLKVKNKNVPIPSITEREVLISNSSSSCLTDTMKRSKVFKEKGKAHQAFSNSPLRGRLTYVQKAPCEVREAMTFPVSQTNSVKLIEKQVAAIMEHLDYSAYFKDSKKFDRKFKDFTDYRFFFFNRDLTKEGITKPRQLIWAMIDALEEVFPDFPAWKYRGIYDGWSYVDENDEEHQTKRGHGLGMANALTTFMQCVNFHAYMDELHISSNIDALFFNDDGSIGCENSLDLETYKDGEDEYLKKLGLIPKGTKTWFGNVCILCEKYSPSQMGEKISYVEYARRIPFSASCIIDAKALCNLTLDPYYGEPRWDLFTQLLEFFGTESGDIKEYTLPAKLGGWVNFIYGSVDISFLEMSELSQFELRGLACGAPQTKPKLFSKQSDKIYITPLERLERLIPEMPQVIKDFFLIGKTEAEVASAFSKNKNYQSYVAHMARELKRRRRCWETPVPYLSWRELFEVLQNQNPLIDILPPRMYLKFYDPWVCSIEGEGRFTTDLPLTSVCSFYSTIKWDEKTVPWPVVPQTQHKEPSERKVTDNHARNYHIPGRPEVLLPGATVSDRVLLRRDWVDSYNVWAVWSALTGTDLYPSSPFLGPMAIVCKEHQNYMCHIEKNWHIYKYTGEFGYTRTKLVDFGQDHLEFFFTLGDPVEEERPPSPEPPEEEVIEMASFDQWYFNDEVEVSPGMIDVYMEARSLMAASSSLLSVQSFAGDQASDSLTQSAGVVARMRIFSQLLNLELEKVSNVWVLRFPSKNFMDNEDEDGFGDLFGD